MAEMQFRKAERKKAWLKIALTGPSGSGKTYSALKLAQGLGAKIAVVDTENGSASLYAGMPGMPEFDVLELEPPFVTEKYRQAMNAAVKSGYDVVILDSISPAWNGPGGIMDRKDDVDARGGKGDKNKFTNWAPFTKEHQAFIATMLHADVHLIATMRAKQEYVLGEGNKPVKVGMAPVQREGMEYEFGVVFDIAMNHTAQASKDRTGLFREQVFKITDDTGKMLVDWLGGGSGQLEQKPLPPTEAEIRHQKFMAKLHVVGQENGYDHDALTELARDKCKVTSMRQLTEQQMAMLADVVKKAPRRKGPPLGSPEDIRQAAAEASEVPEFAKTAEGWVP